MITNEDIESYLLRMDCEFTSPEDNLWIIHDDDQNPENIVIYHDPPVITFRVKLMDLPSDTAKQSALFETLLRKNASEMVAGAYGIEGDSVVIVDTLQSENLDYNELQASIDSLSIAISMSYAELASFRDGHGEEDEEYTLEDIEDDLAQARAEDAQEASAP